jgi:predicted transposase YbfD/YdcC
MGAFAISFVELADPRAENARHDLVELLFIAMAAKLCGAESCADMADFGHAKESLLRKFLRLEHGIPSHDTFSRVFRLLDPEAFEAVFRRFMAIFTKHAALQGVVAIDGKSLRGAFERGKRTTPLHLLNVWAVETRLAIAQRVAPGRNELAGALEVLNLLSLKGCIVTGDALHGNRQIAQRVLDRGGEYVLAVKGNQAPLLAAVQAKFEKPEAGRADRAEAALSTSHGRAEQRQAIVVPAADIGQQHNFPGLNAVARITLQRRLDGKDEEPAVRYFLLSCPFSAARLLDIVRAHWSIENQLHWVLDVVFDEDGARNRKDHGPANLAILRKLALNLLRSHPDKGSLRGKIKKAGWNDAFLLEILTFQMQ